MRLDKSLRRVSSGRWVSFSDAIAPPSNTLFNGSVGGSLIVSDFGDNYRIYWACELVYWVLSFPPSFRIWTPATQTLKQDQQFPKRQKQQRKIFGTLIWKKKRKRRLKSRWKSLNWRQSSSAGPSLTPSIRKRLQAIKFFAQSFDTHLALCLWCHYSRCSIAGKV